MGFKDSPIQQKLMRVIMLTSGAALLMTCAAFFIYEYISFRELTKQQVTTLGNILASNSTAALAFDDEDAASEILDALKTERHIQAACIYDKEGRLFVSYPSNLAPNRLPGSPGTVGYLFKNGSLEGYQPIFQGTNQLGTLYLKSDLNALYSRFRLYAIIGLTFLAVSFLFASLLSKRLQSIISKPILQLAETARQISSGNDYSVRAKKWSKDEVGQLTDAFNQMLSQIETQNTQITGLNQNLEQKVKERTSELENAHGTLKQQHEFIKTIIDSSVDLIVVFDKELRFLVVNKQAETFYSAQKDSLIGKELLELYPQVRHSGMIEDLRKALQGEIVHNANYKSAITHRNLENFCIPLRGEENEIDRVLLIAHDITGLMEATDKLKNLNTALEKSNLDLEQFAYVASHDLQEPLRKIQIFSELSEQNADNPGSLKNYMSKINSSAKRMSDLINSVLNYSRLSRMDLELAEVNLQTVIDHIRQDLDLMIDEKQAILHTGPLPVIKGIPLQITQLFLNLVTNSLKFCERRPEINISAQYINGKDVPGNATLPTADDYLEITVQDNGIGFDQQFADKIFNIFQRLHKNRNIPGTGIGLALCKKIVENHGGFIRVASETGSGTTFFIYFPHSVSA